MFVARCANTTVCTHRVGVGQPAQVDGGRVGGDHRQPGAARTRGVVVGGGEASGLHLEDAQVPVDAVPVTDASTPAKMFPNFQIQHFTMTVFTPRQCHTDSVTCLRVRTCWR